MPSDIDSGDDDGTVQALTAAAASCGELGPKGRAVRLASLQLGLDFRALGIGMTLILVYWSQNGIATQATVHSGLSPYEPEMLLSSCVLPFVVAPCAPAPS